MSDATQQSNPPEFVNTGNTSGMNVTSQVVVGPVKPVGSKTVEGSTPGDHRNPRSANFSTDQSKNQAGPRGETERAGA